MMIDIKEYIKNISAEKFEELCVEYLRYLKGNSFKIKGTRYCKDGGKDIVGTAKNHIPYEIWAECKKHSRSIGLDEIAKNVVLVLSENINELIFFSTSNITASAQKHISNLAARHNFAVAYYYGDKLFSALSELPSFRISSKENTGITNCGLNAKLYLSKYANSDYYEKDKTIVLQRDTVFYIDIFLNNSSAKKITNIKIDIPNSNDMLLHIQPYNLDFDVQPYCDRVIQIKANVVNCLYKYRIPTLRFDYVQEEKMQSLQLSPGFVDPTQLIYFPLVSVELNQFLKLEVEPILAQKEKTPYIIDIRGGSGVGKSRLIKEILQIGDTHNWHIKYYDGNINKDLNIIKDFICSLIGLPFCSGNINFTVDEIKKILRSQADTEDFAEILYNFIYMNKVDNEILYYIEDALLYWIQKPYLDYAYILAIDNIQEMDSSVLEILKHLFNAIRNLPVRFLIVLGTNTEHMSSHNIENIPHFFKALEKYNDGYRLYKEIRPLDKKEAKIFYINFLKNIEKHESFLNLLVAKAGTRPLDMIMQLKYMQEKEVIVCNKGNSWFINNIDESFIDHIPSKSMQLIQERVNTHLSFSQNDIIVMDYQQKFKLMIKLLLIFRDNLPIEFLHYIRINEEVIIKLMDSLFFKYDDEEPEIHFYHNNLYLFFLRQKIYSHDNELKSQVVCWINENPECQIKNRDSVMLYCYIALKKYDLAKKIGMEYLKNNFEIYNYNETIEIANMLLSNKHFDLGVEEEFKIKLILADSYRSKINHEKGAFYYNELLDFVATHKIDMSEEDKNRFYKDAINANLNSNHPDIALNILNKFQATQIENPYYNFILYDRFAVVYLALGMIEEAEKNIRQAIVMAEEAENNDWKGIAYSDYAYLQYRGFQNVNESSKYFYEAYNVQFPTLSYQNRIGELLQQKAFAELLCANYEEALKNVNQSLVICKKIHNTYLEAKSLNLKGICLFYRNEIDNALRIWAKGIDLCQEIKNLPCEIRLYCNLGAFYLSKNILSYAEENLLMAYKLFKKNHFNYIHYKELFYNLFRLWKIKGNDKMIEDIVGVCHQKEIEQFYEFLTLQKDNADTNYGILYYRNCNFIF